MTIVHDITQPLLAVRIVERQATIPLPPNPEFAFDIGTAVTLVQAGVLGLALVEVAADAARVAHPVYEGLWLVCAVPDRTARRITSNGLHGRNCGGKSEEKGEEVHGGCCSWRQRVGNEEFGSEECKVVDAETKARRWDL